MRTRFAIASLIAAAALLLLALPVRQPNTSPTTLAQQPSTPAAPREEAAPSATAAAYEIEVLAGVGATGGPTDLWENTGWHPDKDTNYLAIDIAASADTEIRVAFREVRTPSPGLYYYARVAEAGISESTGCHTVAVEVTEAVLAPGGIPVSTTDLGRVRYVHVAPDVQVNDTILLTDGHVAEPVGKTVATEAPGCPFSGPHLHQSANVNNAAASMWRNVDVSGRYEDDGLGFDDYPPVAVTDPAEFCSDTWIFKVYPPLPAGEKKAEWAPRATPFAKCGAPDNPPANVVAAGGDGTLVFSWTPPDLVEGEDDPVTGYRWRARQAAPSAEAWSAWKPTASASSHELTGLTNGSTYAVQVRAVNASGGPPATVSATPSATLHSLNTLVRPTLPEGRAGDIVVQPPRADHRYASGSQLRLTASPNSSDTQRHWTFRRWVFTNDRGERVTTEGVAERGPGEPPLVIVPVYTESPITVTLNANVTATAVFAIKVCEPGDPTIVPCNVDESPTFGARTEVRHSFTAGQGGSVTLPEASGGNGPIAYALTTATAGAGGAAGAAADDGELPEGVSFDPENRTLSVDAAAPAGTMTFTLRASDSDTNTAASDDATLTVTVTVRSGTAPPPPGTPVVSVTAGTSPVTEGTAATFTISRTRSTGSPLLVNLSEARSGSFFTGTAATSVRIEAGSRSKTHTVSTDDDTVAEDDGSVTVTLQARGSAYSIDSSAGSATVTVLDDDEPPPTVTPEPDCTGTYTQVVVANPPTGAKTLSGGGTYPCDGTPPAVSQTPNTCFTFDEWTATMSGSTRTVTANYDPDTNSYALTPKVGPDGNGSVSGGGSVPCGGDPPDVDDEPDVCYELDRWDGDRTSAMTSDRTVTAHFVHDESTRTLTVRASPPEGGTVGGGGAHRCGRIVTATATVNAGWQLVRWSPAATVRMTRSGTVTAYFERTVRPTYSLDVTESGCCGSVSVSPSGPYYQDANPPVSVTLTATASPDTPSGPSYSFDGWSGDCSGRSSTCTVTMNGNKSVTATFSNSCDGNTGIGCRRQEEGGEGDGEPPPPAP